MRILAQEDQREVNLANVSTGLPLYPGFHLSQEACRKYGFSAGERTGWGRLPVTNYTDAQTWAQRINRVRDAARHPELTVRAGQLHGIGLVDRILHHLADLYLRDYDSDALSGLLAELQAHFVNGTLKSIFDAYRREFLPEGSNPPPNELLRDLLRWWLTDRNEAFTPCADLYRCPTLSDYPPFRELIAVAGEYFRRRPVFGPEHEDLLTALRDPAILYPHSISGQLEYLLAKWRHLLGHYYILLLRGIDYLREEEKPIFPGHGPGPAQVLSFDARSSGALAEPERFSPDRDWMPRLVLIAKSTYVWLVQLSKYYDRDIRRLDQIPDEELDRLAGEGFTGLWLIGVWERSRASRKLKQRFGKPDAIASAYSLYDYVVASDLGGQDALENLKQRAAQRGIRLASDMVPNHTGLDSKWLVEHPDWFVQSPMPPFPAYSFRGENLSDVPGLGLRIEDHYYERTDAAVVFQRTDAYSTRYIYHGNDGTDMPWNDTAQLNYLLPEVREAVLQKIVEIARQFPIIRFDAAMTLAKKHYQRLWFPEPGKGGDIPSRAAVGMTRAEFDRHMPEEFWREVVDRIAAEVPDTLLLAEAFWLMEGYFVRTLGMHRVYNSAFMNMLKNEENAQYRETLRNVLDYNPEILKRFVNFMNNPDEETAVAQFGRDDKYFGTCLLMCTLPGLPMFGHGQIEGFTERYGMEYARPLFDEHPDEQLFRRHQREIFPLLRKRYLFAEIANFTLYDFKRDDGTVDENVFAYSNRMGNEAALIVFHNRFATTRGRIHAAYIPAYPQPLAPYAHTLGEALSLYGRPGDFVVYRDLILGLYFIYPADELARSGLPFELDAFKYAALAEFREIPDTPDSTYAQLCGFLNGRGVANLDEALREVTMRPFHEALSALLHPQTFDRWSRQSVDGQLPAHALDEFRERYLDMLHALGQLCGQEQSPDCLADEAVRELDVLLTDDYFPQRFPKLATEGFLRRYRLVQEHFEDWRHRFVLYAWTIIHRLGELAGREDGYARTRVWLDEYLVMAQVEQSLRIAAFSETDVRRYGTLLRLLAVYPTPPVGVSAGICAEILLADAGIQSWLQVNRYQDVLYFNHELFIELLGWLLSAYLLNTVHTPDPRVITDLDRIAGEWLDAEKRSEYQLDRFLNLLLHGTAPQPSAPEKNKVQHE